MKNERYLFLGIGGMGMAPLAIYLVEKGIQVEGLDDALRDETKSLLESHYIKILDHWSLWEDYDAIVYSNAIAVDDPRLQDARQKKIPTFLRGEMLANCAQEKKLLAVCGSHGKTTTTAMLVYALKQNQVSFSYILGGLFAESSWSPANYQEGEWLIAEIDESDGTIEGFSPEITLCLPLSWDHPQHYPSFEALTHTFAQLFTRTQGTIFYCDRETLANKLPSNKKAKWVAPPHLLDPSESQSSQKSIQHLTYFEDAYPIRAIGAFNALNGAMALEASREILGYPPMGSSLEKFLGVWRRQQILLESPSQIILQDYAHHPSEVQRLIEVLEKTFPQYPLTVVFQPHRFTRTKSHADAFARILGNVSAKCYLLPVYSAGESDDPQGRTDAIIEKLPDPQSITFCKSPEILYQKLFDKVPQKRLVAFVGAGDIWDWAQHFVTLCQQPSLAASMPERFHFRINEPLANKTTFRLGGTAQYYAEPENIPDLQAILEIAQRENWAIHILGRGSNVLVPDQGVTGLVIRLRKKRWRRVEVLKHGKIVAYAGAGLKEVSYQAGRAGIAGLEFLEGIPGNIGGALRMNAGAMGNWIFDLVESVQFMNQKGEIQKQPKDFFQIGYRNCRDLADTIAIRATLKGQPSADPQKIKDKIHQFAQQRRLSQPHQPSAGCMFRNPESQTAGALIDQCGLKEIRDGGIAISGIHANFMINQGSGSFQEVMRLVSTVQGTVKQKAGIDLVPEVQILGQSWDLYQS